MGTPPNKEKRTRHTTTCVFCQAKDLTETHIWPRWLNNLLRPTQSRFTDIERIGHVAAPHERKISMGSIFSQKPYLWCVDCNTKWMQRFEDEMLKFAKPLFTGGERCILNNRQIRIFSVWVGLITVLSEYIDIKRTSVTVSRRDRSFIKRTSSLPDTWTVVACSSNAEREWRVKWRYRALFEGSFETSDKFYAKIATGPDANTVISSFGMGKIFVQVFHCPHMELVQDFRVATKAWGFTQLWPPPMTFWPFKRGTAKFPTKLTLTDQDAEEIADKFHTTLNFRRKPAWSAPKRPP